MGPDNNIFIRKQGVFIYQITALTSWSDACHRDMLYKLENYYLKGNQAMLSPRVMGSWNLFCLAYIGFHESATFSKAIGKKLDVFCYP
jgi:hypothetical protein